MQTKSSGAGNSPYPWKKSLLSPLSIWATISSGALLVSFSWRKFAKTHFPKFLMKANSLSKGNEFESRNNLHLIVTRVSGFFYLSYFNSDNNDLLHPVASLSGNCSSHVFVVTHYNFLTSIPGQLNRVAKLIGYLFAVTGFSQQWIYGLQTSPTWKKKYL